MGIHFSNGDIKLNPPGDTKITDEDDSIVFAEDDSTIFYFNEPIYKPRIKKLPEGILNYVNKELHT